MGDRDISVEGAWFVELNGFYPRRLCECAGCPAGEAKDTTRAGYATRALRARMYCIRRLLSPFVLTQGVISFNTKRREQRFVRKLSTNIQLGVLPLHRKTKVLRVKRVRSAALENPDPSRRSVLFIIRPNVNHTINSERFVFPLDLGEELSIERGRPRRAWNGWILKGPGLSFSNKVRNDPYYGLDAHRFVSTIFNSTRRFFARDAWFFPGISGWDSPTPEAWRRAGGRPFWSKTS